jgi:hypothetical protein
MKHPGNTSSAATSSHPFTQTRGQQLRALYGEAGLKLESLFSEASEVSFSTLMYLGMNKLHAAYPQLSHDEIEALFMGLVKRRRSPSTSH